MAIVKLAEVASKLSKTCTAKDEENSSSWLYVLHKPWHKEISRSGRSVTAKFNMHKKVCYTCKVVVLLSLTYSFFLTLSLASPSSLLQHIKFERRKIHFFSDAFAVVVVVVV